MNRKTINRLFCIIDKTSMHTIILIVITASLNRILLDRYINRYQRCQTLHVVSKYEEFA